MLGERFGWCQESEDKHDELLDQSYEYAIKQDPKRLGWVDKHRYGSSVTKVRVHVKSKDVCNTIIYRYK